MSHHTAMQQVHQILPGVLGGKGSRRSRRGGNNGTLPLFPADEVIRCAWEYLAGKVLASRTRPLRIFQNRLIVEVPDGSWPKQLRRYEGLLVERIQRLLGEEAVTAMEWHVNPGLATPVASPTPTVETLPPRIPPQADSALEGAAEKIRDPELRRLFLRTTERLAR